MVFKKAWDRVNIVGYNIVSNQIMPINSVEQTITMYILVHYCGLSFKIACLVLLLL